MEKRSNALSIVLGLICAGLIAYIAFNKPLNEERPAQDNAAAPKNKLMDAGAHAAASGDGEGKSFCGIPPATLIDLIRNYKTEVWSKTSNIAANQLDARFMEVDIDQLESFIAYAKNSAVGDGMHVTSLRLYYINYGGPKKTEAYLMSNHNGDVYHDYSGCHSLAFVPVVGDSIKDPNRKDSIRKGQDFANFPSYQMLKEFDGENSSNGQPTGMALIPNYDCNAPSMLSNHNQLCPPLSGCVTNTLLNIADTE
jgi:hypothetical protein